MTSRDTLAAIVGAPTAPFDRDLLAAGAMIAAPRLLGALLVRRTPEGVRVGRITETEAYTADDPASHSFAGRRPRNVSMFARAGTAYVYHIYGTMRCFNVATGDEGVGEAVLIRALEPLGGLDAMSAARGVPADPPTRALCGGPSRLCDALDIRRDLDGADLLEAAGALALLAPTVPLAPTSIAATPRIGVHVAADWPRRFVVRGSPFLSRPYRESGVATGAAAARTPARHSAARTKRQ